MLSLPPFRRKPHRPDTAPLPCMTNAGGEQATEMNLAVLRPPAYTRLAFYLDRRRTIYRTMSHPYVRCVHA